MGEGNQLCTCSYKLDNLQIMVVHHVMGSQVNVNNGIHTNLNIRVTYKGSNFRNTCISKIATLIGYPYIQISMYTIIDINL